MGIRVKVDFLVDDTHPIVETMKSMSQAASPNPAEHVVNARFGGMIAELLEGEGSPEFISSVIPLIVGPFAGFQKPDIDQGRLMMKKWSALARSVVEDDSEGTEDQANRASAPPVARQWTDRFTDYLVAESIDFTAERLVGVPGWAVIIPVPGAEDMESFRERVDELIKKCHSFFTLNATWEMELTLIVNPDFRALRIEIHDRSAD